MLKGVMAVRPKLFRVAGWLLFAALIVLYCTCQSDAKSKKKHQPSLEVKKSSKFVLNLITTGEKHDLAYIQQFLSLWLLCDEDNCFLRRKNSNHHIYLEADFHVQVALFCNLIYSVSIAMGDSY